MACNKFTAIFVYKYSHMVPLAYSKFSSTYIYKYMYKIECSGAPCVYKPVCDALHKLYIFPADES